MIASIKVAVTLSALFMAWFCYYWSILGFQYA